MSSVCSDSLARSTWHLMYRSCEMGSAMGEGDFLNTIVTSSKEFGWKYTSHRNC